MLIYENRHVESAVMDFRMKNPDALEYPPEFLPDRDVPPSETLGRAQLRALALYFASLPVHLQPTHAFFSGFIRAQETGEAAISLLQTKIVPVIDSRIEEILFGDFERFTKKGRAARFPEEWELRRKVGKVNHRPPGGGQNWHDKAEQVRSFQHERIDTLPNSAVVYLATHEVVALICRGLWEGLDFEELAKTGVPSGSLTIHEYDGTTFKLIEKNMLPPSPDGTDLFSMESKKE